MNMERISRIKNIKNQKREAQIHKINIAILAGLFARIDIGLLGVGQHS